MRPLVLTSMLTGTLVLTTVPHPALASAPTPSGPQQVEKTDQGPALPSPGGESSARQGRAFIDTSALGDEGPFISKRCTSVIDSVFTEESVAPTDDLAGPVLKVTITRRDGGGYEVAWEVAYNGSAVDDGTGSFECPLCTEDELAAKIEQLGETAAPLMVVPAPEDPELDVVPDPSPTPEDPDVDGAPTKLGPKGKAGVALLAVGGAALIPGVALLVRKPTGFPEGDPNADKLATTRPAGGIILGLGVAAAVTGAVLLVLDRKGSRAEASLGRAGRRAVVHPWVSPRGGGMGVTGRF